MAAMDLHGDFAGPQLKSDLLIEHSRNYQGHNLTLACSQSRVALSQFGKVTLLLARHTVAIQSLADRIQQVLILERLGQELHGTGLHGSHRHGDISVTGDENDGHLDSGVTQLALKVQTIDARKTHVQDKAAWSVRLLVAQKFFRRLKGCAPQPRRFQQSLDGRTHTGIVINDEHCGSICSRHSGASALVGRLKQKLAPRGELLAAHKRPPCDSMMEWLMRSPMPVP